MSAAPIIEASGERKSCDTEDNKAERKRSVSLVTLLVQAHLPIGFEVLPVQCTQLHFQSIFLLKI